MISPAALEEAATVVGMWSHTKHQPRNSLNLPETLWHLPGDPIGVPSGHPYMVTTIASWLRAQVVASGENDAHMRYLDACRRLDPVVITVGVVFASEDFQICAAMVALGYWSEQHARLVLRSAWRELDDGEEVGEAGADTRGAREIHQEVPQGGHRDP